MFSRIQYMNKSNNNKSRASGAPPNSGATTNRPRNPVQGRGRGPRPAVSRSAGQPASGASSSRPPRGQVQAAAAYATGMSQRPPQVQATRDQARIVHRELIGSMSGSVNFAVAQTIPLNPGMASFAPWLASQASAWERYRFNKLRFFYYTRTGSTTPGSMMLVPDYDAADSPPLSEQVASSFEDVEEDAPWKDICCVLKPSSLHALGPSKFIRSTPLPANLDIKTYDAGTLYACTTDGTATAWGKLWVEYDVTLFTPQLNPAGATSGQHIESNTFDSAHIVGTPANQQVAPGSVPLTSVVGNVVTFAAPGKYLVVYSATATTSLTQTAPPAVSAGSTILQLESGGAAAFAVAGSGGTALVQVGLVSMLAGGTITFNNTDVLPLLADFFVVPVPNNLS